MFAIFSIEKNFSDERADERRKRFQKDTKQHKKKNPVVFSQPTRGPLIDTVRCHLPKKEIMAYHVEPVLDVGRNRLGQNDG